MNPRAQILTLQRQMREAIVGQERVIERILLGLLANGNLLLEGMPGLAKTRAVKALAGYLDAHFSRIQFTPDLLPSDVTGTDVLYQGEADTNFRFEPGPIFANIVLGDELNRAPAKVQAAMLEAMEERQVTVAGKTHKLPDLFMVLATRNPVDQEGTYPLPEAQLDRFLMNVEIGYPTVEDEMKIVSLVRAEENGERSLTADPAAPTPVHADTETLISQDAVFAARSEIARLTVSDSLLRYIADLVAATRRPEEFSDDLNRWLEAGASPRASIALDRTSRAHAWLGGRDYVDPENVRAILPDVLSHRVTLSYEAQGDGVTVDEVISELVRQVALP